MADPDRWTAQAEALTCRLVATSRQAEAVAAALHAAHDQERREALEKAARLGCASVGSTLNVVYDSATPAEPAAEEVLEPQDVAGGEHGR